MQKGRGYPYHDDLWCVETTQWPHWVPRFFRLQFTQPQPLAEWAFITIADQVTDEGIPSVDRLSIRYPVPGELGIWEGDFYVFCLQNGSSPPNATHGNLIIRRPGIPNVHNADVEPWGAHLFFAWANSDVIPPWYDGQPLLGRADPCAWAFIP